MVEFVTTTRQDVAACYCTEQHSIRLCKGFLGGGCTILYAGTNCFRQSLCACSLSCYTLYNVPWYKLKSVVQTVDLITETIIMDIHRKLENNMTLSCAKHVVSDVRIKKSFKLKALWYINHVLPRKQSWSLHSYLFPFLCDDTVLLWAALLTVPRTWLPPSALQSD